MRRAIVVFEPDGRRACVPIGSTIFEAAVDGGVGLRSECGGKGECGKCRVIVKDASALSGLTDTEKKHLPRSDVRLGYRLACQAMILKNVTVIIPPESRLGSRKIQASGMEKLVEPNPLISKIHVVLPEPTLSDARPDYERLLDALSDVINIDGLKIDYELIRVLPDIIRGSNFNVTAAVYDNGEIVSVEPGDTSNRMFGLAVDIGTSKIVVHLVDLVTGHTLDVGFLENPQLPYGEDIITRILFASSKPENLKILQECVINAVNKILDEMFKRNNVHPLEIYEVMAVGNTAMHHFFLGIEPKYTALSPFTPALRRRINVKAGRLGLNVNPNGVVSMLPIIAGCVGADAVADALATGICESEAISLLVDIGTNSEVLLGNSSDVLTCSCASGPAFEGAHIKYGMKAVEGAIERVQINSNFDVKYETIGGVKPAGICGSGVIDAVAELFEHGLIDSAGKFNTKLETSRLRKADNELEFVLAWRDETSTGREITITQKDVREIQLAKAAIYTGCSILMKRKGIDEAEIGRVLVAGAFGNCINPVNAKVLGLLPDMPTEKITFVGNTAISGAKMALISKDARMKCDEISKRVRYLELATDPNFKDEFFQALFIPHKNLNRFPTVRSVLGE